MADYIGYLLIILKNMWYIFREPWLQEESLWMVLPLISILVLIHIYFGRYRSEELGWNSAFGNSISLFWILVTLLKYMFHNYLIEDLIFGEHIGKLMFMSFLTVWFIGLFSFNFFHALPKKFAFFISSSASVYILAYIGIAFVVGDFMIDGEMIVSAIVLFVVLFTLIKHVRHLIPMTDGAKQVLRNREVREKKENAIKKGVRTRKWNRFIEDFWWKKKE